MQGFLVSSILSFLFAVQGRPGADVGLARTARWLPVACLIIVPMIGGLGSMTPAIWVAADNLAPWLVLVGAAMAIIASRPCRDVWAAAMVASLLVIGLQPVGILSLYRKAPYLADIIGGGHEYQSMDGIPEVRGLLVTTEQKAYAENFRRLITEATRDGGRYRLMNLNILPIEVLLSGLPAFGEVLTQEGKWDETTGATRDIFNDDLTCRFLARNPLKPGERVILVSNVAVNETIRSCLSKDHHLNFPGSFTEIGTLSSSFFTSRMGKTVTIYRSGS